MIKNLEEKFKLIREHFVRNGQPKDPLIANDWENVKYDTTGLPIEDSIGSYLRGLMMICLNEHSQPIPVSVNKMDEYISLWQKGFYFGQETINTIEEFEGKYSELKIQKDLLYRGQKEAKWRLYNTLQREWLSRQLESKFANYLEFIKVLKSKGKEKFDNQILEILKDFDIPSTNDISILGFLQHHSCPTPLIDWTFNLDVALYFSLDELQQSSGVLEIENYFSIYYYGQKESGDYKSFWDEVVTETDQKLLTELIEFMGGSEERVRRMREHFAGRSLIDKSKLQKLDFSKLALSLDTLVPFESTLFSDNDRSSGIIFSLHNNKNIRNQNGAFAWNNSPNSPLEEVGRNYFVKHNPDVDVIQEYRYCYCLNINKSLEKPILEKLRRNGIDEDFIYVSKDINAREIFDQAIA